MENIPQNYQNNQIVESQIQSLKENQSQALKNRLRVVTQLQRNIQHIKMTHLMQPSYKQKNSDKTFQSQQTNFSFQALQQLAERLSNSKPFSIIMLIILSVFLISCIFQDSNRNAKLAEVMQILELLCHVSFIFFFCCRILKNKEQKNIWLFIDFTTIICGIIGFAINQQAARYLKAIRTLKILFFIKQIQIFNRPASVLMKSLAKFGNILIPAVIIIYVYAVVGLYIFSDFQFTKCRSKSNISLTQKWTVYNHQIFLCGQKKCPVYNGEQLQCLNPIDYYVEPDPDQLINIIQGNGLLKYSNIFFAMLSTFKQTFVTGSSRLIILYKQVLNPIFIQVYFYSYIYLISYIYLNIFYALIITSEWDGENSQLKLEQSDKNKQLKNNQNNDQRVEQPVSTKDQNLREGSQNLPCFQKKKEDNIFQQEHSGHKLVQSNGQNTIFNGSLVLKKTKISKVFQNCDQTPNFLTSEEMYGDQTPQIDKNATIASQFPQTYRKYEIINNIIILLCCINLSLDFHGQSEMFKFVVDCIDFCFYVLLILELVIRILVERYSLRRIQHYTKFQIMIAVICTAGIIFQASTAVNFSDFFSVTNQITGVIRSFKYLRIMILIFRSTIFKEARLILQSTFRSLFIIKNMVVVWFLIVVLFGIIGFHLHSHKTKVNTQTGKLDLTNGVQFQVSFDSVYDSIIFTMLTFYNQQWDYIMFQQYLGGGALLVIWQLFSICVGLLLFSKYFMALLMKQLDNLIDNSCENIINQDLTVDNNSQIRQDRDQYSNQQNRVIPIDQLEKLNDNKKIVIFQTDMLSTDPNKIKVYKKKSKKLKVGGKNEHNNLKISQNNQSNRNTQQIVNKILTFSRNLIEHKAYKIIFGCYIISSCIVLMFTHPHVDINSSQTRIYIILDKMNKVYFIIDLLLNLLVFGLFQEDHSYLRKSWLNWLNLAIIIIEAISFTSINTVFVFRKIEKIKVFRILFFVQFKYKHDWNMRITYHSFVQLLPKVMTLLIITLLMYSYFALILVKLYRDDLYYCVNHHSGTHIVTQNDCLIWGGDWVQQSVNVSNLLNSTFYLFAVATMEGWITLLYPAMNLAGQGLNPVKNANKYISSFFMAFFFFGNLIMLNVFIGLSVSNFKRLKDKNTGDSKLKKKQKQWLSVKSQIYRLTPPILIKRPENIIRGHAYDIANNFSYKIIQGFFFISFLVAMSLVNSNMTIQQKKILLYLQYFFVFTLICQYLIELLAFGVRTEYKRSFIFKNIVVGYAILYIILTQTTKIGKNQSRIFGGIFIALQLIRYMALLDEIPFAKKLLNTIASILPQTSNILLMICITLFIYAIIGMELFSFLKFNIQLDSFNQNYTNFSTALFALIKFSTLQSPMQQISDAAQQSSPNFLCTQVYSFQQFLIHGQQGCGNKYMSFLFFLSFHVFYSMLLMSTVMAVIVDSYIEVKREEEAPVTKLVLEKVRTAWSLIDPQATGYIPYRQFWMFTAKLLQIYMGKKKAHDSISALCNSKQQLLRNMGIPIYENQDGVLCFQFHQVIEALTRIYMKNNFGAIVTQKTEKMFKQRQSLLATGFKKSFYNSSNVSTLIILKSGLRLWKKLATNQTGRMQYRNVIQKFNKQKTVVQKKDQVQIQELDYQ